MRKFVEGLVNKCLFGEGSFISVGDLPDEKSVAALDDKTLLDLIIALSWIDDSLCNIDEPDLIIKETASE